MKVSRSYLQKVKNVTNQENDYHKWILFTEEELSNICAEISGKHFSRENGTYIQFREPLLNEKGVAGIKLIMKSILNPNTFLSNLSSEADMFRTGRNISLSILQSLMLNRKEWGLDMKNIQLLFSIIENYIDFAIRRAFKEGDRKFAENTMKTTRSVSDTRSPYVVVPAEEEVMDK